MQQRGARAAGTGRPCSPIDPPQPRPRCPDRGRTLGPEVGREGREDLPVAHLLSSQFIARGPVRAARRRGRAAAFRALAALAHAGGGGGGGGATAVLAAAATGRRVRARRRRERGRGGRLEASTRPRRAGAAAVRAPAAGTCRLQLVVVVLRRRRPRAAVRAADERLLRRTKPGVGGPADCGGRGILRDRGAGRAGGGESGPARTRGGGGRGGDARQRSAPPAARSGTPLRGRLPGGPATPLACACAHGGRPRGGRRLPWRAPGRPGGRSAAPTHTAPCTRAGRRPGLGASPTARRRPPPRASPCARPRSPPAAGATLRHLRAPWGAVCERVAEQEWPKTDKPRRRRPPWLPEPSAPPESAGCRSARRLGAAAPPCPSSPPPRLPRVTRTVLLDAGRAASAGRSSRGGSTRFKTP
jgi:hypothetical protein